MSVSVKRKIYPTAAQKSVLISLVEADEELRRGKFSSTFTKKVAERRWSQIAQEVNAIPGANKTWFEWRKTWQDMKSKTKKLKSAHRRQLNMTGGGPPPPPLSDTAVQILSTINESSLVGHTDSVESAVVSFIDFDANLKTIEDVTPAPAASEDNDDILRFGPSSDEQPAAAVLICNYNEEGMRKTPDGDIPTIRSKKPPSDMLVAFRHQMTSFQQIKPAL